ncbi:sodium- and chloride-dependent GABA transporter 2-like [Artemia franciscana]
MSEKRIQPRGEWSNKIEFILSTMGFCIGLGNVWRFPYLCYKNGGGAFLVPYLICLLCGGVPIFFLEVALGQYTAQGGISAWRICPIFQGIGLSTTIICCLANLYYIVVIAWAIHYLFASFSWELPWGSCNNSWNTEACTTFAGGENSTLLEGKLAKDATLEYWERNVLQVTSGIDEPGGIQWELAGTLFIAWLICIACIFKGVKSTGKAVYVTATFPYLMLTILLIRGLTLEGASKGLVFYLKPDFSRIFETQVWIDAGTQIFFSYAVALGTMIALGSYNKYHNNFFKQCIWISVLNSSTSLYSGLAIFSVLGFMAHEQGVDVGQVAESGPGLIFIAYPKAITQMPLPALWSILFFIMVLLLGTASHFVAVEGFITAVVDIFPDQLRRGNRRFWFMIGTCVFSFTVGLTMVTRGGIYVFQIFDYYSASGFVLLWISLFEALAIGWGYGADQFVKNVQHMIGYKISPWLKLCWKYFTPTLMMVLLFGFVINYKPLKYNNVYEYPLWGHAIGWTIAFASVIMIPSYALYALFTTNGSLKERLTFLLTPQLILRDEAFDEELNIPLNDTIKV